ncbi:MAG: protein-disulfide reductase DsbD domain-containing protein [Flavisolibacter sp.]
MKQLFIFLIALSTATAAVAQAPNPVSWNFSSKKVSDGVYEVQLVASIQPGWHLYSQQQPEDAIAIPTSFNFNKHPLITFDGGVKEMGKLEKFSDPVLKVSANQYSNKVVFVQKVKLRGKAKTAVSGKLEFQTCDDEKCLPPKTVSFSINLS